MENYIIKTYIFGVISWAALFLIARKMFPNRSIDFCGRLVAIIHSLQAVFFASILVQDWTDPVFPLASTSSPLQMKILAVSLAFFSYDLVRFLCDIKNIKNEDLFHHFVAIAAVITVIAYQRCGSEAMAALWMGEFSSPFADLRELLKELGYKATNLNLGVDILLATGFTFSRMIFGTYLASVVLTGNYPIFIKVLTLGFKLLHIFWFCKIISVGIYKYKYLCTNIWTSTEKIH